MIYTCIEVRRDVDLTGHCPHTKNGKKDRITRAANLEAPMVLETQTCLVGGPVEGPVGVFSCLA